FSVAVIRLIWTAYLVGILTAYRKFSTSINSLLCCSVSEYKMYFPSGESDNPMAAGPTIGATNVVSPVLKLKNRIDQAPSAGPGTKKIPSGATAKFRNRTESSTCCSSPPPTGTLHKLVSSLAFE